MRCVRNEDFDGKLGRQGRLETKKDILCQKKHTDLCIIWNYLEKMTKNAGSVKKHGERQFLFLPKHTDTA